MISIQHIVRTITNARKGRIAEPMSIELPVVPPFTTSDGREIDEQTLEREAIFDAISFTNQKRQEAIRKIRRNSKA